MRETDRGGGGERERKGILFSFLACGFDPRVDGRIRRRSQFKQAAWMVEKIDRGEGTKGRNTQLTYYSGYLIVVFPDASYSHSRGKRSGGSKRPPPLLHSFHSLAIRRRHDGVFSFFFSLNFSLYLYIYIYIHISPKRESVETTKTIIIYIYIYYSFLSSKMRDLVKKKSWYM